MCSCRLLVLVLPLLLRLPLPLPLPLRPPLVPWSLARLRWLHVQHGRGMCTRLYMPWLQLELPCCVFVPLLGETPVWPWWQIWQACSLVACRIASLPAESWRI